MQFFCNINYILNKIVNNKYGNKIKGGILRMNSTNKELDDNNLKVIKDQLHYESLMNKKFNQYSTYCVDPQLKSLCNDASSVHKQNFNDLKTYLDSHQ